MICIEGHRQFTYEEALGKARIEPGIKPVYDVLYRLGCIPLASCEGHPNAWCSFLFLPKYMSSLLAGLKKTRGKHDKKTSS